MTSKHDEEVKRVAKEYERKGYKVQADLPKHDQPPSFNGCRPDVYAVRGTSKVIVEVETPRSIKSDKEQQECLRRAAERQGASFKIRKTN